MKYFKINDEYTTLEQVVLMHESISESIEYKLDKKGRKIDNEDFEVDLLSINFEETESIANNCGVTSFDGLNEMAELLKKYDSLGLTNVKLILDEIIKLSSRSIVLFSTNEDYPELIPIMDKLCNFKSKSIINMNFQHPIKVWGFYHPKATFPKTDICKPKPHKK